MELIRKNAKGKAVKELQQQLIKLGYSIKADGDFGNATEVAVKDFQMKNELTADGIVGAKTKRTLTTEISKLGRVGDIKLTEQDLIDVALKLEIEVPTIKAVYEVESRGSGFLSDKRPKILFEGHIFWRQLKAHGIEPEEQLTGNKDILYSRWTRKYYEGGIKEYDRLNRAISINETAAFAAASWGTFQIMGFNYKSCGFEDVMSYVSAQYLNEGEHLKAFGNFIQSMNLVRHLQSKNWAAFARGYNGPSYKVNRYDDKLAAAYTKYSNI